jgi:hypothetical protein
VRRHTRVDIDCPIGCGASSSVEPRGTDAGDRDARSDAKQRGPAAIPGRRRPFEICTAGRRVEREEDGRRAGAVNTAGGGAPRIVIGSVTSRTGSCLSVSDEIRNLGRFLTARIQPRRHDISHGFRQSHERDVVRPKVGPGCVDIHGAHRILMVTDTKSRPGHPARYCACDVCSGDYPVRRDERAVADSSEAANAWKLARQRNVRAVGSIVPPHNPHRYPSARKMQVKCSKRDQNEHVIGLVSPRVTQDDAQSVATQKPATRSLFRTSTCRP